MQLNTARKSNKTYGKGTKTLLVHDLFDYRSHHDKPSTRPSSIVKPASLSDTRSHPNIPQDSLSPDTLPHPSKIPISGRIRHERPPAHNESLYDIPSSDDDDGDSSNTSGSRSSKRRRLVGTSNDGRTSDQGGVKSIPKQMNDSKSVLRKTETRNSQRSAHNANRPVEAPAISQRPERIIAKKSTAPQTKTMKLGSISKRVPVQHTKRKEKLIVPSHYPEDVHLGDQSSTDASESLSEHSIHSTTQSIVTPRRKRLSPAGNDSDMSSPGNVTLSGLKLNTPGLSPAEVSPEPSSDINMKQKRKKRRLIDRLDAPVHSASEEQMSDAPATSVPTTTEKSNKPRSKLAQGEHRGGQPRNAPIDAEGSQDSQTRTNWAKKPRTTYATQRSHLSDMVNDLDGLDEPSSQKSADDFLLQISASNTASQLELEDESDDSAGGSKLKSIHELRQAGVNNRFERELDTLLEDIDAGKTASKALRLQALMKLIGRLQDSGFARHIATSGRVARLTAISGQKIDLPASILLTATYSALAETATISQGTLSQLFKAVTDLAPCMLTEGRSLVQVAKDRKQNLSKALIRELADFVETFYTDEPRNSTSEFCSDWTMLCCLEAILKKLVQLGDTSARLSTSVYATILQSLSVQVQHLGDHIDKSPQLSRLETTLSLLELCSFCVDDADLHIADTEYETLGRALAEIIYQTASLSKSLEGHVLRVVVSLSNNRPRMCRLLGNTTISKATFSIISENFLKLAHQADIEETLNQQKLDSVVLALGCLLNFAECDSDLRTRLSERSPGEEDYIAQLVTIFNSQVSKVDEAMTTEQGQVSVAFGYLAMLLCTLSLHPGIKGHVTQLLRKKSFNELCSAAEKFFSHLRTLQHISEDDASMSTFTARFSTILETVRAL